MRAGTEIEIKLALIRHGATKSNLEHRYLGKAEEALSREGIEQLLKRKEGIAGIAPETVFSSPMLRCRQTARILFPDAEVRVIPEWTEIDFGLFEGKNYQELDGDGDYQRWIDSGGTLPFPGGESREEFAQRVMKGFDRLLEELPESGANPAAPRIAAVVHGGTVMALCSSLFGGEYFGYQQKCAEGYFCRFLYGGKAARLKEFRRL